MRTKVFKRMKKQIAVVASVCVVVGLALTYVSCNNDDDINANKHEEDCYIVQSSISKDYYTSFLNAMEESYGTRSTFNDQDEAQIKQMLIPLVEDGKAIQTDLIEQAENLQLEEDVDFFEDLSDEQLASLSFLVYEIQEQGPIDNQSQPSEVKKSLTGTNVVHCLSAVFGVAEMKQIIKQGVLGSLSANAVIGASGKVILKQILKHYVSWIGLGLAIYEFYDCMDTIV